MTNTPKELAILAQDNLEIKEYNLTQLSVFGFELHNAKAFLKNILDNLEEKERLLEERIKEIAPYELDEEGKLLSSQISNKETGEAIELFEWKQSVKKELNREKAQEIIEASLGVKISPSLIFDELKPKSKEKLLKDLKEHGLTLEAAENCFDKITRSEPKLVIKKLK